MSDTLDQYDEQIVSIAEDLARYVSRGDFNKAEIARNALNTLFLGRQQMVFYPPKPKQQGSTPGKE